MAECKQGLPLQKNLFFLLQRPASRINYKLHSKCGWNGQSDCLAKQMHTLQNDWLPMTIVRLFAGVGGFPHFFCTFSLRLVFIGKLFVEIPKYGAFSSLLEKVCPRQVLSFRRDVKAQLDIFDFLFFCFSLRIILFLLQ